jgi:hypothetical protein
MNDTSGLAIGTKAKHEIRLLMAPQNGRIFVTIGAYGVLSPILLLSLLKRRMKK